MQAHDVAFTRLGVEGFTPRAPGTSVSDAAARIRAHMGVETGRNRRALSGCSTCVESSDPASPICLDIVFQFTGVSAARQQVFEDAKVGPPPTSLLVTYTSSPPMHNLLPQHVITRSVLIYSSQYFHLAVCLGVVNAIILGDWFSLVPYSHYLCNTPEY